MPKVNTRTRFEATQEKTNRKIAKPEKIITREFYLWEIEGRKKEPREKFCTDFGKQL